MKVVKAYLLILGEESDVRVGLLQKVFLVTFMYDHFTVSLTSKMFFAPSIFPGLLLSHFKKGSFG